MVIFWHDESLVSLNGAYTIGTDVIETQVYCNEMLSSGRAFTSLSDMKNLVSASTT